MDLFLLVMMMMVTGILSQSVSLCVTGVADNLPVVLFSVCMQKLGMLFRLWSYVTTPHLASDTRLSRSSAC